MSGVKLKGSTTLKSMRDTHLAAVALERGAAATARYPGGATNDDGIVRHGALVPWTPADLP